MVFQTMVEVIEERKIEIQWQPIAFEAAQEQAEDVSDRKAFKTAAFNSNVIITSYIIPWEIKAVKEP